MMKLLDVAEAIARDATCAHCARPSPVEFATAIRKLLARQPRLLDDPDTSVVLCCGSCSARGLCERNTHRRSAWRNRHTLGA